MKKILAFGFSLLVLAYGFCFASNSVNINTATLEELETLTGIGAIKAQAIINSRPYSSLDDLLNVSGIGEKTLAKIKEQGLACVDCSPDSVIASEVKQSDDKIASSEEIASSQASRNDEVISYPTGILINEILPSAKGSDETGEWIEIYNSNNFEVDLAGWKLKDTARAATNFTIPSETAIQAYGFLVFTRPQTKITLNNDGDGVVLLNPSGETVDSAEFSKSTKGQSWARISDKWQWTANLTPGLVNAVVAPLAGSTSKDLPKEEKSVNNSIAGLTSANSDNNANQENPWFLFLTAVAIAVVSATIVLFIKFKLSKINVRT